MGVEMTKSALDLSSVTPTVATLIPITPFVMSQHASLKKSSNVGAKRSVLKRFERVKLMQKRGNWEEGRSPMALPKTAPEA